MGTLKVRDSPAGPWYPITGVGTNPQPPGMTIAEADLRYVNITGDSMSGRLWIDVGNAPAVSLTGTGVHQEFWTDGHAARTGYLQGHASGLTLQADIGNVVVGTAPGYLLAINSSGNHTMAGNLSLGAYQLTAQQINTPGILYCSNGGGGWFMQDASYIRSYNDKHVWIGAGWYGGNGGIQLGYSAVVGGPYIADFNGYTRSVLRLDANGGVCVPNGQYIFMYNTTDTNHVIRYNGSVGGIEIASWGKVRIFTPGGGWYYDHDSDGYARTNGYGWWAASSIKIKENIEPLAIEQAVDTVRALRPVTFDRIDGVTDQVGFIAEWTEDVAPYAVAPEVDENTLASMDYGKLTPVLTRVVQDLLDRVTELENKA